jgi:hypothetical protein
MEYIVVLVTSYFRYLSSAPKVHWQGAEASRPRPGAVAPARANITIAPLWSKLTI